ncbi:MAG: hypothetical protein ACLSHC_07000 [Bilophila wadsworthia]
MVSNSCSNSLMSRPLPESSFSASSRLVEADSFSLSVGEPPSGSPSLFDHLLAVARQFPRRAVVVV